MNRLGRKVSLIILTILSIIGFSLTGGVNDVTVICIGRIISGLSIGASVLVGKLNDICKYYSTKSVNTPRIINCIAVRNI